MTEGPYKIDSSYHEAWILKRNAMIQTALNVPAQQCTLIYHMKLR